MTATVDSDNLLVLGGHSDIGMEVALRMAAGRTVVLAARRNGELQTQVDQLVRAGARKVDTVFFDADDLSSHGEFLDSIVGTHGPLGTVVLAFGILGDNARAQADAGHAVAILHTDYVAQVSVLTHAADMMKRQGSGRLVVFSSVAVPSPVLSPSVCIVVVGLSVRRLPARRAYIVCSICVDMWR